MQGNFLKVFNTYPVGINRANGFKIHNELTMYPPGNYPLAPSDRVEGESSGVFRWSFGTIWLLQQLWTHQTCDGSNIVGHLLDDWETKHKEVERGLPLPQKCWEKEAAPPPEQESEQSSAPMAGSSMTSPWEDLKEVSL